jgi:hypothetical protein
MRRGPFNPGPIALLLVAAVAVPEFLKHCKPLAKSIGDFLVKAGEDLQKVAGTEEEPAAPNEVVSEVQAEMGEHRDDESNEELQTVDPDTASPAAKQEVEAQKASEQKGDAEAPAPSKTRARKPKTEATAVPQPKNPKGRRTAKPA